MNITMKEAVEKLMAAKKLLITAHVNPDGDAGQHFENLWLCDDKKVRYKRIHYSLKGLFHLRGINCSCNWVESIYVR